MNIPQSPTVDTPDIPEIIHHISTLSAMLEGNPALAFDVDFQQMEDACADLGRQIGYARSVISAQQMTPPYAVAHSIVPFASDEHTRIRDAINDVTGI